MSAKARLLEWAMWRLEPGFNYLPMESTPLSRIVEDRQNAGARADYCYDILEIDGDNVPCAPDGGMAEFVDRAYYAITHDQRCREIDELVNEMRRSFRDYWNVLDVTYSGTHPRDVRKGAVASAAILGIRVEAYRRRMREIYEWLEARLGRREAA